jgi:hypothetical protein
MGEAPECFPKNRCGTPATRFRRDCRRTGGEACLAWCRPSYDRACEPVWNKFLCEQFLDRMQRRSTHGQGNSSVVVGGSDPRDPAARPVLALIMAAHPYHQLDPELYPVGTAVEAAGSAVA